MSFDPALVQPGAWHRSLQRPAAAARHRLVRRGRASGRQRTARTARCSRRTTNNFAPRLGLAWDVNGDGKSAVRARPRLFYPARASQPGLNVGNNPPFVINDQRHPDARFDRRPMRRVLRARPRRAQRRPRAARGDAAQLAVERVLPAGDPPATRRWTSATSANKGYDLLADARHQPGARRATSTATASTIDSTTRGRARRRRRHAAVRRLVGDRRITIWDHGGEARLSLDADAGRQPLGRARSSRRPTRSRARRSNVALDNSAGSLSADDVHARRPEHRSRDFGPRQHRSPSRLQRRAGPRCCPRWRTAVAGVETSARRLGDRHDRRQPHPASR